MYDTEFKPLVTRPTHLGSKPRTAAALLRQTHKFLTEEGRWIKGRMFKDGDAKQAYERGFCGKWGVCSVGALGVVSGEFTPGVVAEKGIGYFQYDEDYHWADEYDSQGKVVSEACAYLSLVINPGRAFDLIDDGVPVDDSYGWLDVIINWNDAKSRKRKQVLDAFAAAAELAAKPEPFESIARKYLASKGFTEDEY